MTDTTLEEVMGMPDGWKPSPELEAWVDAEFERVIRADFEKRCMTLMNEKRAAGIELRFDNGCEITPETLFWKKPNGDYGVELFNAAWMGYRFAIEFAQRGPVTMVDNRSPELQPDGSVVICGQRTGERFDPATGASL